MNGWNIPIKDQNKSFHINLASLLFRGFIKAPPHQKKKGVASHPALAVSHRDCRGD